MIPLTLCGLLAIHRSLGAGVHGFLRWEAGLQSAMTGTLYYETKGFFLSGSLQVAEGSTGGALGLSLCLYCPPWSHCVSGHPAMPCSAIWFVLRRERTALTLL